MSETGLSSHHLIARHAGSALWLARYMERIENLARLLDVTKTFARDAEGGRNWLSLLRINGDAEAFFAKHAAPEATSVAHFYLLDCGESGIGAVGDPRGEGQCAHPAGADLHRDVAPDQRVPWPDPRAECDRSGARGIVRRLRDAEGGRAGTHRDYRGYSFTATNAGTST